MSEEKMLDDFIERIETEHELPHIYTKRIIQFNNGYLDYELNADLIAKHIMDYPKTSDKVRYGGIFLGYGYSTGAIDSNNNAIAFTHQHHYMDTPVWYMNVAPILNIDIDNIYFMEGYKDDDVPDDNEQRSVVIGEYLRWLINPSGNEEIADEVLKRITIPMIREVCGKLPGRAKKEIHIISPLISATIDDPNWEIILKESNVDNVRVTIEGPSVLFKPAENERLYVVYHHEWEFGEAYIIHVIELAQTGLPITIGAYGFLSEDTREPYIMKNPGKKIIQLSALSSVGTFINEPEATARNDLLITPKLEISEGFLSYLGRHSSSFYYEFYAKIRNAIPKTEIQSKIINMMPNGDSIQMANICATLCKEGNMLNIALSDMVTVGISLENRGVFKPTTLPTHAKTKYGTNKHILPRIEYRLESIPVNYGAFSWQCKSKKYTNEIYLKLKNEELQQLPLDNLIEMIIQHYTLITTSIIAEEVLFIYGSKSDPTALFTARLFVYMSNNEKFVIESKSEIVNTFEIIHRNEEQEELLLHNHDADVAKVDNDTRDDGDVDYQVETSILELWEKYHTQEGKPLIVVKRVWNRDYCFVVEKIKNSNSLAIGKAFIAGKQYKESSYNAHQKSFVLYNGPSINIIIKQYTLK